MTENPIIDAMNKGTFSVLEVAKGRGYPQDIVDVYLDHDAAFKIHRLEARIASEQDGEKVNALDDERRELVEKVKASRLTFHLRGISEDDIEAVQKQATEKFGPDESNDKGKWSNGAFLAQHIVSVTNAEGEVDSHKWTADEVVELWKVLPTESFNKLLLLMQELTFAARYFDEAVSTDF